MMQDVNPWRLVLKALLLFIVFNLVFAAVKPPIWHLTIYNWLVKGRERLPSGGGLWDHDVSPDNLDAAFASHEISRAKGTAEYRVVILGDSAVWGVTMAVSSSLAAKLNQKALSACGKKIRFYNLAFPAPSAIKDFVILNRALLYQPDLVVWFLTPSSVSMTAPPRFWGDALYNSVATLLDQYHLGRYRRQMGNPPTFLDQTLVGQHATLARMVTLQVDGLIWQAAAYDNVPHAIDAAHNDVQADRGYAVPSFVPGKPPLRFSPQTLRDDQTQYDVLRAARRMVGKLPVLVINEPTFIATGRNSDIRYNDLYPRWAYDQLEEGMAVQSRKLGWSYADLYDAVPPADFQGVLHMDAAGEAILADVLAPYILGTACH